jgi:uncharacterized membrane protein
MTLKEQIISEGHDYNALTKAIKSEIAYIDKLAKRIELSVGELHDGSSDEDREMVVEAREALDVRKAEFLEDFNEYIEKKKAAASQPKPAAPAPAAPKAEEPKADEPTPDPKPVDTPTPDDEKQDKDDETSGGGLAGYIIGGIALLATFGAINYFRRR